MRLDLAYGFVPYLYIGPKSTGKRVCDLLELQIADSDLIAQKMTNFMHFQPYKGFRGDTHMVKKGAIYKRHDLILRIARVLQRMIDYSDYQKLEEKQKSAFVEQVACALTTIILPPLKDRGLSGNHFYCSKQESGRPGEGYFRTTTIKLCFDLPSDDQIMTTIQTHWKGAFREMAP